MINFGFQAIGTTWKIDIKNNLSKEEEVVLLKKIMNRIEEFDKTYSRFRDDSLIIKMSRESGEFILPEDCNKMMLLYKKFFDLTGGLVTPLIGQVLVDSGYDAQYSLEKKNATVPKSWDEVLKWGNPKIRTTEPVILDFGAGGKGYLVDLVSEILEKEGVKSYCVDAGGDMRQKDEFGVELRVGLENPSNTEEVIGVVTLKNRSLCGSAGNRRVWADLHHIINPQTLSSPTDILSVWVIADETILADLLTTALFFVEAEKIKKEFDFEYLILKSDLSIEKSDFFQCELFIS